MSPWLRTSSSGRNPAARDSSAILRTAGAAWSSRPAQAAPARLTDSVSSGQRSAVVVFGLGDRSRVCGRTARPCRTASAWPAQRAVGGVTGTVASGSPSAQWWTRTGALVSAGSRRGTQARQPPVAGSGTSRGAATPAAMARSSNGHEWASQSGQRGSSQGLRISLTAYGRPPASSRNTRFDQARPTAVQPVTGPASPNAAVTAAGSGSSLAWPVAPWSWSSLPRPLAPSSRLASGAGTNTEPTHRRLGLRPRAG